MQPPLLSLRNIGKRYGPTPVLQGIDFQIARGESIALIGENGAGKSTFFRIVTGVIAADAGEIRFEGRAAKFASPRDALARGIAFIPQELACVPDLSVADNILLNQWPTIWGLTTRAAAIRAAQAECRRYGLDLGDLNRRMGDLKLADRQIVEIVKALSRRAKLIVLDEPTAALSEAESKTLFTILDNLNQESVAVLYISHRMDEVFQFSHQVAVLRNGRLAALRVSAQTNAQELIADMLGQTPRQQIASHADTRTADAQRHADPALALEAWSLPNSLHDISFSVAQGEVVGLYGLRGSGVDVVAEGLGGLRPEIHGAIARAGQTVPVFANPIRARRAGVAYLPAERKRNGLILSMPIRSNLTSMVRRAITKLGMIQTARERSVARRAVADFAVKCTSIEQNIAQLSGGNQQKVLLASRMLTQANILVLHEPTRGVDIGARAQIHQFLAHSAQSGCAILLATSDLAEAVTLSHRLLILRDGRLVGELTGARKTQAAAIALAAGETMQAPAQHG